MKIAQTGVKGSMLHYSTTRQGTFDEWALSGVLAVWAVMAGTMLGWVALYVPQMEDCAALGGTVELGLSLGAQLLLSFGRLPPLI